MPPTLADMATTKLPRIHNFRAGRHTAMSGAVLEFSEADLAASAQAYDPAIYQAPIVVGHPKIDAPAYGWVAGLAADAGEMYADADQVDAQFAEMVEAGRFKKVSSSWFPPNHPRNPVPGVYYLKHIGFLGAAAPAVTGLKPVEYAEDDTGCLTVEFAYDDQVNAGLWRRMREWMIGRFGLDEADKVVPDWQIQTLDDAARQEAEAEAPQSTPMYAEGEEMSDVEKARLQELEAKATRLEAENAQLKTQTAEFADREAALTARETEARQAEIAEFAEKLVGEGKVLPRDKAGLIAYLAGPNADGAIEFAEGESTVAQPADEWLRNFLSALPPQVDFAERGAPDGDGAQMSDAEVARRARDYKAAQDKDGHFISFAEAVDAVHAGTDRKEK